MEFGKKGPYSAGGNQGSSLEPGDTRPRATSCIASPAPKWRDRAVTAVLPASPGPGRQSCRTGSVPLLDTRPPHARSRGWEFRRDRQRAAPRPVSPRGRDPPVLRSLAPGRCSPCRGSSTNEETRHGPSFAHVTNISPVASSPAGRGDKHIDQDMLAAGAAEHSAAGLSAGSLMRRRHDANGHGEIREQG